MALKDCIRKLGKLISKDDRALLQSWLDEGLTDEQAVQRYMLAADMEMIEVVRKAKASGELQVRNPDVREVVSEYATAAFNKAEADYEVVLGQVSELQDTWARIEWIKDTVQYWQAADPKVERGRPIVGRGPFEDMEPGIDLDNDAQVMQRLSAMFFANPGLFREGRLGRKWGTSESLLQGTTPLALFESWQDMLDHQQEILKELEPVIAQKIELENRMEDLDAQRFSKAQENVVTFNQGPIDDGKPQKTVKERMQEELDFLSDEEAEAQFEEGGELEAVAAKGGMDQQRMAALMGAQLYGDMAKSHQVTVKELFQNSFDAVRTALNKGQIEEGTIEFAISDDGRTLTIIDNGVGMTADMVNNGFLTIAGTEKEGDVNSGGFGVAKGLFLAGNESLTLETVRDGVKTTLSTTGADYNISLKNPEHSLDQRYPADRALRRSKTDEPPGTKITVKLPESFVNFRTGSVEQIPKFERTIIWNETDEQLLDRRIEVIVTRDEQGRPRAPSSGKHFNMERYRSLGSVQFEWGVAEILLDKDERVYAPYRNTAIHVNGLRQLSINTVDNPWSFENEKLKRQIHINIKPNMKAGEPGYPFSLNRQELQEWAKEDIFQIQAYLAVLTWRDKTQEIAQGYGVLQTVDSSLSLGEQLDLTPPPAEAESTIKGKVDTGEVLEVRDGQLFVDGKPQKKLDPENMERQRLPDATEFRVDQDLVPHDKPLVHSQMKFKESAYEVEEGYTDYLTMDFNDALMEKFGQERVLKYFYNIGHSFEILRDMIAVKGDPDKFGGVDKAGVGVSVLGNNYYGVHTRVPAMMMFINPGADPRHSQMLKNPSQLLSLNDHEQSKVIAASMMTVMLHEIAHFAEMNHQIEYIIALQSTMGTLIEEGGVATRVHDLLEDAIYDNRDIFDWISNALRSESIEPAGLSLTDVGSELARIVSDADNAQGERAADETRAGAAGQDRPGATDRPGGLDDESISAGYREGGVVVPQGSVHPEAGQKSQLNKTFKQDRRGFIEFDELRKAYIRLTEASDFSTFIHESGHLYLELMRRVAAMDNAPQQILDDWQTILDYLGVATGEEITVEHHEKWARSFEAYAMEGKAPSMQMQDAFNAFRRWMITIYKKVKALAGIELNDDIRGVMDRMLASDEQIKLAEEQQGFTALFLTAEEAGVSQEQFDLYKKRLMRAHDDAVDRETKRLVRAMRRDQREWYKEQKKKVQAEVEEEAYAERVYVALAKLQKDQLPNGEPSPTAALKIDKASLMELVSDDQSILNRLPKPYIYTTKGNGTAVDVVAQMLGYKDPMKMIKEMIEAPAMSTWIRAETNRRMAEIAPDPLTDGTLADMAMVAVHDHKRSEIMAMELRALRQKMREDRPALRAAEQTMRRQDREAQAANKAQMPNRKEVQMIRAAAKVAIARKAIRNIKPHLYLTAERKAGRLAFEAMRKRDYATAYKHKLEQIHAVEMFRAAVAAHKTAQAAQKYLAKFNQKKVQRKMGKAGVLEDIQAILEGVDLRRRSMAQVDKDKSLQNLRDEVERGRFIVTPATLDRIFDDRVNWQELSFEEFLGMRDLVKQIEHSAERDNRHYVNDEWVEFELAEGEVVESIYENNKKVTLRPGDKTPLESVSASIDQGISTWLRTSSIARVLDKSGFGALTRRIIVPMRRAYSEKLIPMLHKAQQDVADIYNRNYSKVELQMLSRRNIRIDGMDGDFSRSELLTVALNWGSETNRAALLGGVDEGVPVYPEPAVREMLSHLTAKDWQFVQDIWDYLDTYREPMFEAEKRRRGIAPERVEPVPFTVRTADGEELTLKGGYYPLRYDHSYEAETQPQEVADEFDRVAFGSMVTASTRAGATYNRVRNHGKVVRLGLNTIDTHLREIVRDIAVGDETLYIKRLLDSREVRRAFKKTGNEYALQALNLWLTDAAVGELPAENIWEAGTAWIRVGFTKAKLGWNMAVMMLQFTGAFQTMAVIGTTNYLRGVSKLASNPVKVWKHVMSVSKFLNTRYEVGAWNKDVQDTRAYLDNVFGTIPTAGKAAMNKLAWTYFLPIAKAQQVVDITTWLGAYHKGMNELDLSEADSIIYADTQVEAAQTSGFFSDRSGFERGTTGARKNRQSQWVRIWSTLLSYMLAKGNIAYEKTKGTDFRKPSEVARYFSDLMFLFMVEGIASAAIYGRMPDADDEPEEWIKWTAAVTVDSAVSGVPYAREVIAAKYGGGNTPIGVFSNDVWRFLEQSAQGEADVAAIDAFLDVVGTATHTPTGQISKTFKAVWQEDDTAWYELVFGPRKDD